MKDRDSRKRRRPDVNQNIVQDAIDTSKPSAVFKPIRGRNHTVSVAIPGSIIANALTHDLKTALAGQIARALAVFCIDEVIIFNDGTQRLQNANHKDSNYSKTDFESGYTAFAEPDQFLHHLLSYLETPPYLRRALFPHHPNLRTAGSLPSVDMPHHLKSDEWCQYREGVTLSEQSQHSLNIVHAQDAPQSFKGKKNKKIVLDEELHNSVANLTYVNTGLQSPIAIPGPISPNTRVTIKFPFAESPCSFEKLEAEAARPETPREEAGYYWGYNARLASSITSIFTDCPFDGGYDFSIGTSERGEALQSFQKRQMDAELPTWNHLVIVFGGVSGLEVAVRNDNELKEKGVTEPKELFDAWVNLIEGQGSRTIRTEEALWIGLMGLRSFVLANNGE